MIRALIIDDEPLAHEVVKAYLDEIDDVVLAGQCYSAKEALEFLKQSQADLLLLDINMPVISGLDFLSMLKDAPCVIITSAYEEYALEGYQLDVVDYLLKPYRFDRFEQALEKVRKRLSTDWDTAETLPPSSLLIKVDKKHISVAFDDIDYLEAYGNYVKVWRGADYLLTPATLTSFAETLPANQFVRVHKSFIANKSKVNFIEEDTLVLKNDIRLPVGKSFRKDLLAW